MRNTWKVEMAQLPIVIAFLLTASPFANSVDSITQNGIPSPTIQKTVEHILLQRMTRPNETLFETETKQLLAKFLVDLAVENNSTQTLHPSFEDQSIQKLIRQDEEAEQNIDSVSNTDHQFQENAIPQTQNQNFGQTQQFPQETQFSQQQQINQNQQFFPQQQVNQNQQFAQPQQINQNQFVQQPAIGQNQQIDQNQQFQQQQIGQNQVVQNPGFPQTQQIGQNQFPQSQFPQNQQIGQNQFLQGQFQQFGPTRAPETFEEVDKLIQQIFRLNVTGILDQSLYLTGSNPVRNLLGGVLKLVFCDPISRLLGRCKGNNTVARKLLRK